MNTKFLSLVLVLVVGFSSLNAEAAKRIGSGKSVGQQSNNVSQSQGIKPAQNAAPAAAAPQRRPWGAMLGGLAAGLGLAWLANSMGFGEQLGQFMMFGLLALVIMVAIGYFMKRKTAANVAKPNPSPFAFQGAAAAPSPVQQTAAQFASLGDPAPSGSMIGSGLAPSHQANWSIPSDFETEEFLSKAKQTFVIMQDAWDRSDTASLRAMMTDPMLLEIKAQIAQRDANSTADKMSKTEVVTLDAKLLGIEESAEGYLASVKFSGTIREEAGSLADGFSEVWNMSLGKKSSSGWLVAGIQATK